MEYNRISKNTMEYHEIIHNGISMGYQWNIMEYTMEYHGISGIS